MTSPGDDTRLLLTVVFAAWAMAFAYAFWVAAIERSIEGFLGWQAVAGLISVAVFGVSRKWPKGAPIRKHGSVPLIFAIILGVGVLVTRFGPLA